MNVDLNRHVLILSHQPGAQICLFVKQAGVLYDRSPSLSYLFYRFQKFVGSVTLFGYLNLISIRKRDGPGITESDALGISVAVIAFHRHAFLDIKEGMIERAGHDAGLASNAQIFIDDHPVIEFGFSVAGLGRTHFETIGFFTVITNKGKVNSRLFPLDHFNPGTTWIARPSVIDRAHEFTLTASRALLLVDH
jgi:hypothetical protein